MDVTKILDSLGNPRLKIVETGCVFTLPISKWVSSNSDSEFISVDLDFQLQLATHKELEAANVARYVRLLTKDHNLYLSSRTWVDICFLNPPDLQSGLAEFLLATSTGARVIVMSDYQSKAASAIRRAKEIGWIYESAGSLNILRQPK